VGQAIIEEAQKLTGSIYGFSAAVNSNTLEIIEDTEAITVLEDYLGNINIEIPTNSDGDSDGINSVDGGDTLL
jgi:hypothetical protein